MEYRLNKYISASGYCSRREADRFIESGNVTINGRRASIGDRVMPGQKVKVNGNLIESDIKPVYIAFNKPVGIAATSNLRERNNIIDFIKHEQKIFPIGQLEIESQGLVLLTNDAKTADKILNANDLYKKIYIVTVNKPITDLFIESMSQGVSLNGQVTRKCKIEKINPYTFKITLLNESNRQVQKMCEYLGYEIHKLECVQIMNISLDKLGQGNYRDLSSVELNTLFDTLESVSKSATSKQGSKFKKSSFKSDSSNSKTEQYNKRIKSYDNVKSSNSTDKKDNEKVSGNKSASNKTNNTSKKSNILKGPREGKSKVKSIKDKTRRWYQ